MTSTRAHLTNRPVAISSDARRQAGWGILARWPLTLGVATLVLAGGCPDPGESLVKKGHVYFADKDYAAAEAAYRQASTASPRNAAAMEGLGNVHFERGELDDAISAFQRSVALDPTVMTPRHKLAVAYASQGANDDAIRVLEDVIAMTPRNAFAHHSLGGLYRRVGRRDDAEKSQRRALEVDPSYHAARFALGVVLLDAGDRVRALEQFEILQREGATSVAEYGFALSAAHADELDRAAAHLERVLDLSVPHPERILSEPLFRDAWERPAMASVRRRIDGLARSSTVSTASVSPHR